VTRIVIVGAGLTGLSAAYHLEKRGFSDYLLLEQDETIGGLCRSVQSQGFTFDFTGHLLHASDAYFRSFIAETIGLEELNQIVRRSFIYSHETFTRYPFQVNLHGLPPAVMVECIEGFLQRPHTKRKARSFREWVLQSFGSGFGKHFFFPYQRKIFAYSVNKLSSSWTGRFVPATSLHQIIQGALADNYDETIGYNAHFYYPKAGGIETFVRAIAHAIKKPIMTGVRVTQIDVRNKRLLLSNGNAEQYDHLITTMPLDTALRCMKEPANSSLKNALAHLKCGSVVNFNLGINRADFNDKHWVYFPETRYPFYRIGFPHNLATRMAPPGTSSLYGEFSHMRKPQWWVQRTLKDAIKETKKVFSIADQEVIAEQIMYLNHAYVTFDLWRDRNLPKILDRLAHYDIHSVGRYGAWKYSSMQEAILDGKAIADTLTVLPAHRAAPAASYIKQQRIKELAS
jgi:protoporphyrinogen oxidase